MARQTIALISVMVMSVSTNQNILNNFLFNGEFEFIDLTHSFNETESMAGEAPLDVSWFPMNTFDVAEQTSTHIDAPNHFRSRGLSVNELPLEKLIVPLIIVDVSGMTNGNPNFVLTKNDLDGGLINYNFGKPCVMVFKFGWSKYFNDVNKYLGLSRDNKTFNFPGLSSELIEWITSAYKNVVGIGVDVASVDPGSSTDFPVHKITARNGLYNLENVNLQKNIPEYGCTALILPKKIAHVATAPVRLVAICPKKKNPETLK